MMEFTIAIFHRKLNIPIVLPLMKVMEYLKRSKVSINVSCPISQLRKFPTQATFTFIPSRNTVQIPMEISVKRLENHQWHLNCMT